MFSMFASADSSSYLAAKSQTRIGSHGKAMTLLIDKLFPTVVELHYTIGLWFINCQLD